MDSERLPFQDKDPSPLIVKESHGDEILFYLLEAREAAIDTLAAGTEVEGAIFDHVDLRLWNIYAGILSSINLRKKVLGIDTLEE